MQVKDVVILVHEEAEWGHRYGLCYEGLLFRLERTCSAPPTPPRLVRLMDVLVCLMLRQSGR